MGCAGPEGTFRDLSESEVIDTRTTSEVPLAGTSRPLRKHARGGPS